MSEYRAATAVTVETGVTEAIADEDAVGAGGGVAVGVIMGRVAGISRPRNTLPLKANGIRVAMNGVQPIGHPALQQKAEKKTYFFRANHWPSIAGVRSNHPLSRLGIREPRNAGQASNSQHVQRVGSRQAEECRDASREAYRTGFWQMRKQRQSSRVQRRRVQPKLWPKRRKRARRITKRKRNVHCTQAMAGR